MHTVIPCVDCDDKRRQLEDLGFQVSGCTAVPERPGFCLIEFSSGSAAQASTTQSAVLSATTPSTTLTRTQVATVQAIVNLFETSEVLGDYGNVTVITGDTGHLTFGRSQTTLGSGNLAKLLQQYCANPGAVLGARLTPFVPRFVARDLTLDTDTRLHNVLRCSADDRVMRETQDRFFDSTYWQPALAAALRFGLTSPLGAAVVYDSHVHGSWSVISARTTAQVGKPTSVGERTWIAAYVAQRRQWLATHPRADLRATVYRMEAMQRLIDNGMWALPLPLVVRGREISDITLSALPPGCYDGPTPGSRSLGLTTPLTRGLDVRRVQLGLSDRGVGVRADGVYGQTSMSLVKAFQSSQGLPATGSLDPATIVSLTA